VACLDDVRDCRGAMVGPPVCVWVGLLVREIRVAETTERDWLWNAVSLRRTSSGLVAVKQARRSKRYDARTLNTRGVDTY